MLSREFISFDKIAESNCRSMFLPKPKPKIWPKFRCTPSFNLSKQLHVISFKFYIIIILFLYKLVPWKFCVSCRPKHCIEALLMIPTFVTSLCSSLLFYFLYISVQTLPIILRNKTFAVSLSFLLNNFGGESCLRWICLGHYTWRNSRAFCPIINLNFNKMLLQVTHFLL